MNTKGALIAAMAAGFLASAAPLAWAQGEAAKVKCEGANECKGKGACNSKANTCAGKNGCKGKGWMEMSEAECKAKGGKPMKESKKKA